MQGENNHGEANSNLHNRAGKQERSPDIEDFRYLGDFKGKPQVIRTLWVKKWVLGNAPPRRLVVTLGEPED
jgi:hypothetical protein